MVPEAASDRDVLGFHSTDYVECLRNLSQHDSEKSDDASEEFGLGEH